MAYLSRSVAYWKEANSNSDRNVFTELRDSLDHRTIFDRRSWCQGT
jgi:hypothetical protein